VLNKPVSLWLLIVWYIRYQAASADFRTRPASELQEARPGVAEKPLRGPIMTEMPGSTPIKILLLEDNESDRDLILRQLRKTGLEFVWQQAMTEAEFVRQLELTPDLILADYRDFCICPKKVYSKNYAANS
jgi:PleD family two-component response regulator